MAISRLYRDRAISHCEFRVPQQDSDGVSWERKLCCLLWTTLFARKGQGDSLSLQAEGTPKVGEPHQGNYFRLYMDRAISQDAFGIPGIDHRGVGGLENCVVSYDLLILPCEGMLYVPSLRAK